MGSGLRKDPSENEFIRNSWCFTQKNNHGYWKIMEEMGKEIFNPSLYKNLSIETKRGKMHRPKKVKIVWIIRILN